MKLLNIFSAVLLASFSFISSSLNAQTPVELHITNKLNGGNFAFNTAAKNNLGHDFSVSRLEYYISKISIKHDGGTVTDVTNHYILANASQNIIEPLGSFNITNVEGIILHVGVDTPANHEDPSLKPTSHPLAHKIPTMHWGWTSGYRFVAMEGNAGTGLSQIFEVHALGDQHYLKTELSVQAVMKSGKLIIPLNADYANALRDINISTPIVAHGDGVQEAKLLANFRDHVFSQGFPVSVKAVNNENSVAAYPNPSYDGNVTLRFGGTEGKTVIRVYDVIGRLVTEVTKPSDKNSIDLYLVEKGIFIVKVQTANGENSITKLQVM